MFTITREIEIDAGHRVPFHDSKCFNLHGHRYTIAATLRGDTVISTKNRSSESGMLMDFGIVKQALMEAVHDPFDHTMILWEDDHILDGVADQVTIRYLPVIPTAEELAAYWFAEVHKVLRNLMVDHHKEINLHLASLTVWETPNSWAEVTC